MQTDFLTNLDIIDPVCGMRIDPHNAAARLCHEGHEFYFCAKRCRQAFEADPQRYLVKGPKRKGIWRRYLERLNKATGGQAMSCH
jgi:YHS domain-containing protein